MAEEAPGLGEQFGRTRKAFFGLVAAHLKLARAEFSVIADGLKVLAALGGCALVLLFFGAVLLLDGLMLFFGETVFGSIGWGVLDGFLLFVAIAAMLLLAIVEFDLGRLAGSGAVALGVGLVVGGLLFADWAAYSRTHSSLPPEPWLAILAGVVVVGLLGLILGASFGRGAAFAGLAVGMVVGLLFGLLASQHPGGRVACAIGLAAFFVFWPLVSGVLLARAGVDMEKLKARFVPQETIDTTKETVEWLRGQLPLGRR